MKVLLLASGAEEAPPRTVFTWAWERVKDTSIGEFFEFNETSGRHLGQYWFEAICFSIFAALLLMLLSAIATRRYEKIPRGLQNILEWAVGLLRNLVRGIVGEQGDKFLPYLGTVFLFIFTMNLLGLVPLLRSPTMTLSTTLALGVTTFFMVQGYAIRTVGLWRYLRHFAGDVLWLAPLMVVVEVIGEFAKPMSLSVRLYGNIFGEDLVVEQLMHLGEPAWFPLQFPMLFFAIFGSFLQAYIFTCLSSIYIGIKVEHHGEEAHAH